MRRNLLPRSRDNSASSELGSCRRRRNTALAGSRSPSAVETTEAKAARGLGPGEKAGRTDHRRLRSRGITPALTNDDLPLPEAPTSTRNLSADRSCVSCSRRVRSSLWASLPKKTAASSSTKASSPGYGTRSRDQSVGGGAGFSSRWTTTCITTIVTISSPMAGMATRWSRCRSHGALFSLVA